MGLKQKLKEVEEAKEVIMKENASLKLSVSGVQDKIRASKSTEADSKKETEFLRKRVKELELREKQMQSQIDESEKNNLMSKERLKMEGQKQSMSTKEWNSQLEDYRRRVSLLEAELSKTQKSMNLRDRDIQDLRNSTQEQIDEIAALKVKLSEVRALNANMELLIGNQQDKINKIKSDYDPLKMSTNSLLECNGNAINQEYLPSEYNCISPMVNSEFDKSTFDEKKLEKSMPRDAQESQIRAQNDLGICRKSMAEKDLQMTTLQDKYDRLLMKQIEKEDCMYSFNKRNSISSIDKMKEKQGVGGSLSQNEIKQKDNYEDFHNSCEMTFAEKLRETNERLNRQQKEIMSKNYSTKEDNDLTEQDKNKTINLKDIAEQIESCQNKVQTFDSKLYKERSAKNKKKERHSSSNKSKKSS